MFKRIAILLLAAQCCLGVEFGISGYGNGYCGKDYLSFMVMESSLWRLLSTNPIQWLSPIIETEAIDQTVNELDADVVNVNVFAFDGIEDTMIQTISGVDYPITMSGYFSSDGSTGDYIQSLSDQDDVNVYIGLRLNSIGKVYVQRRSAVSGDNTIDVTPSTASTYIDGEMHSYELVITGNSALSLTVDDEVVTSTYPVWLGAKLTGIDTHSLGAINKSTGLTSPLDGSLAIMGLSYGGTVEAPTKTYLFPCEGGQGMGNHVPDVSGDSNDGELSGTIADIRAGLADGIPSFNLIDGHSKTLAEVGATTIAVTGLVGTETITSTGTGSVAASAGTLTLTGGLVYTISIDGELTYELKNGYGITLPTSTAIWPAGVLTGGGWNYLPADLSDPTKDVLGNPLTNPGGSVHNNCEVDIKQKAENTEFLDNAFWSADGISYLEKSFEDLRTHLNFEDNVVVCSTPSSVVAIWTYYQSKDWRATEYINYLNYLSGEGCTGDTLIPYPVTGGGIGPDGLWFTEDYIHIYLVKDG